MRAKWDFLNSPLQKEIRRKIVISTEPLERAFKSLERGYQRSSLTPHDEELRDACIQRFEYCFELSWKIITKVLQEITQDYSFIASLSKKNLFREAGRKGLIHDVEQWFIYLEMRNLTSHTYNEDIAKKVYSEISSFIKSLELFIINIKRLDPSCF